jgi:hypothetical protein
MYMTTKVQFQIVQEHMPVVIEVIRNDGTVAYTTTLQKLFDKANEYVHSGQTLRVREMTTEEQHNARSNAP